MELYKPHWLRKYHCQYHRHDRSWVPTVLWAEFDLVARLWDSSLVIWVRHSPIDRLSLFSLADVVVTFVHLLSKVGIRHFVKSKPFSEPNVSIYRILRHCSFGWRPVTLFAIRPISSISVNIWWIGCVPTICSYVMSSLDSLVTNKIIKTKYIRL